MKRILPLLIVIFLVSTACKQSAEEKEVVTFVDPLKKSTVDDNHELLAVYPVDSLLTAAILPLGFFHNDEVDSNATHKTWLGLFNGKDGFYLASTKIKLENVYDVIVDEDENQKTGWEVSAEHIDSCYILIESLPYLKETKVEKAVIKKDEIYPKDALAFIFQNVDYCLYATGHPKKITGNGLVIEDYKLYLTATVNGRKTSELLVSTIASDEKMIKILFAGDIDGDQKLDLIIDTSSNYNASQPTLYLSKPAGKTQLIKPIASHTSVGC